MAGQDYRVEVGSVAKPWQLEAAWNEAVGRRIRRVASRNRVSLLELSRRSQVPYATLYGYVIHARRMPAYVAMKVAIALEVDVSELICQFD